MIAFNANQLTQLRKVSVRQFSGRTLVDIREFYNAGGEEKPGKKVSITDLVNLSCVYN